MSIDMTYRKQSLQSAFSALDFHGQQQVSEKEMRDLLEVRRKTTAHSYFRIYKRHLWRILRVLTFIKKNWFSFQIFEGRRREPGPHYQDHLQNLALRSGEDIATFVSYWEGKLTENRSLLPFFLLIALQCWPVVPTHSLRLIPILIPVTSKDS